MLSFAAPCLGNLREGSENQAAAAAFPWSHGSQPTAEGSCGLWFQPFRLA